MADALSWPGGKSSGSPTGINRWVRSLLPPTKFYAEPFAGMLGVLLARRSSESMVEVVNDLDGRVINWWRVVRDRPAELAEWLRFTPHSRAQLDDSVRLVNCAAGSALERAGHMTVILFQSYSMSSATLSTSKSWSVETKASGASHRWDYVPDRVREIAARVHDVRLESMDAVLFVDKYGQSSANLLYVDPPYEHVGEKYYAESVNFDDLETALRGCAARVALSGYDTCRWDCLGWQRHEKSTYTTQAVTGEVVSLPRREVIWTNYEPPEVDNRLF